MKNLKQYLKLNSKGRCGLAEARGERGKPPFCCMHHHSASEDSLA